MQFLKSLASSVPSEARLDERSRPSRSFEHLQPLVTGMQCLKQQLVRAPFVSPWKLEAEIKRSVTTVTSSAKQEILGAQVPRRPAFGGCRLCRDLGNQTIRCESSSNSHLTRCGPRNGSPSIPCAPRLLQGHTLADSTRARRGNSTSPCLLYSDHVQDGANTCTYSTLRLSATASGRQTRADGSVSMQVPCKPLARDSAEGGSRCQGQSLWSLRSVFLQSLHSRPQMRRRLHPKGSPCGKQLRFGCRPKAVAAWMRS